MIENHEIEGRLLASREQLDRHGSVRRDLDRIALLFEVVFEPKRTAGRDFRILGRTTDELFLGGHSRDLWLCDTKTT